jgi:hypothetical protein
MENSTELVIQQIKNMQDRLDEYQKWDEARDMVITYLREHHGLEKPTDWAYKTISLLKKLEELTVK